MKKGIIAITLLLTGALLITPMTNAISQNNEVVNKKPEEIIQTTNTEKTEVVKDDTTKSENNISKVENTVDEDRESVKADNKKEEPKKEEVKKEEYKEDETKIDNKKEEVKKDEMSVEENKEEVQSTMTKAEAEEILNKYIKDVEKSDFTYTYKGDENTFDTMKENKINGYVFLPNIETDMAYLVDKDSGSIYFFHPSGYFELLEK